MASDSRRPRNPLVDRLLGAPPGYLLSALQGPRRTIYGRRPFLMLTPGPGGLIDLAQPHQQLLLADIVRAATPRRASLAAPLYRALRALAGLVVDLGNSPRDSRKLWTPAAEPSRSPLKEAPPSEEAPLRRRGTHRHSESAFWPRPPSAAAKLLLVTCGLLIGQANGQRSLSP